MRRGLKALDLTSEDSSGEDDEAMMVLIATHQSSLKAFLRSLIPVGGDVDDVLQRANLVIWRKRAQFELGSNFKAWSFAVARWEALSYLKERKRESWLLYDSELAALVEKEMSDREESPWDDYREDLVGCLAKLSKPHQGLIHDRYGLGMSLAECSGKWEKSEGGLRVTLHRLRASLRECLQRKKRKEQV